MTKNKIDFFVRRLAAELYPKCLNSDSKVKDVSAKSYKNGIVIRYHY